MKKLTRDAIIAAQDIRTEEIEVPEWGGALTVRGFTLAQRHRLFEMAKRDGEIDSLRATILTFIEGVTEPKFTLADYDTLRDKSAVVERVAMRILALSGIGKDALESAIKNSAPIQSDTSSIN